jgi:hypothetical protein
MKTTLIFYLFFLPTFLFSQITEDSVEFYFTKILNEYRKTLHYGVQDLTVNKTASLGCEHHNNYLFNMEWVNKTPNKRLGFLSHDECANATIDNNVFKYVGKDVLIRNFNDRIYLYNTNKDFEPYGEVITSGYYFLTTLTSEKLAKKFFSSFMESKPHKETLDINGYDALALDCKIELTNSIASASIVVVIGFNKKN